MEQKNKSLESGEPVLRMIINAIPANALQETIEADIRTLLYFARWKTKPDGSATAGQDASEQHSAATKMSHLFPWSSMPTEPL